MNIGLRARACVAVGVTCAAVQPGDAGAASDAGSAGRAETEASAPVSSWSLDGTPFTLRIALPRGVQALNEDALPVVSDAGVAGVKILLRRGVTRASSEAQVIAVCVRASSAGFGTSIAGAVFDKLNETTRAELSRRGSVVRYEPTLVQTVGSNMTQAYQAEVNTPTEKIPGRATESSRRTHTEGRHVVAFVGEQLDVLACSVGCTEPPGESTLFCETVLGTVGVDGPLVTLSNHVGWVSHVTAAALRRPLRALGLFIGMALMAAGALLTWRARRAAALPG